ncbi:MAG: heme-binding domain-containing protein [Thermoanaerobaculia bacterium]
MSRTKWILLILLIVFVVIQFVRPDMTNRPTNPAHTIDSVVTVSPQVAAILRRCCHDCHDNDTRWPWYARISPVSWWLKSHVTDAKKEFSMPEFATYSKKRQARKLQQVCDEVTKGDMPLWSYRPMHPAAKLSDADKQTLCQWANTEKARIEVSMTPGERAEKPRRRD